MAVAITRRDLSATELRRKAARSRDADAARRMVDHGTTHAIVVGGESERPLGMVSSLDIAGVVAWGRA